MGRSGPGYGLNLRGRIKEFEVEMERALHGEAEEHARELDADDVAARAEQKRLEREAASHAPERDEADR
ncbi:MAG: hypothetical protein ACYDAN_03710 [Candidatus Limnocylindrales bacterium]